MKLNLPEVGYLRLSQILNIIPISKSAWWEGCRSGLYPKPVKLGPRTTAWRVEDIRELMERINKESLYE
ncbi:MAG: AlpA family phage regulatory protein [Mailhella sp.]|nr:AlpA family phage regulatory protein [Mailhella sp.]MBR6625882.1 AlpA family phage regulatory protein [Mailhella sp.]MBR6673903.1 AlpA family phage regulatory protein [Mailhella sp.]